MFQVKQKLDSSISRHLGTTKLELELFGQHPYAAWDKGANHSGSLYGSSAGNFGSLNRHRHPRYVLFFLLFSVAATVFKLKNLNP